jgi:hypothetical protein
VGRHGDDRPQVPARPSLVRHLSRARDLPGGAGTLLPTETLSVYDFAVDLPNLVPTEDDTRMFMATGVGPDRARARDRGWWEE